MPKIQIQDFGPIKKGSLDISRVTVFIGNQGARAYVCNKRHPCSNTGVIQKKDTFFKEYGFRLYLQAAISLVP